MATAYEHYMKVFGVKGFTHSDVSFVTSKKKLDVVLKWVKNEYRAYKKTPDGKYEEMHLGSTNSEHLKGYIMERW